MDRINAKSTPVVPRHLSELPHFLRLGVGFGPSYGYFGLHLGVLLTPSLELSYGQPIIDRFGVDMGDSKGFLAWLFSLSKDDRFQHQSVQLSYDMSERAYERGHIAMYLMLGYSHHAAQTISGGKLDGSWLNVGLGVREMSPDKTMFVDYCCGYAFLLRGELTQPSTLSDWGRLENTYFMSLGSGVLF